MDSSPTKDKTDSSHSSDTYNESLDWIRSMNVQMKSPGNFISSRLESVSLEQVHREFSSLLLTSQSHGSALLRTAFTNATSYNDNLKKIIITMWPIKDKVSDSYNFLKNVRDDSLNINESVNTLLKRLNIVLYCKLAISTILQAQEVFNNLCYEVVDTFTPLHSDNITTKYFSKLSHVVALIDLISKKVYNMNVLIQNLGPEYNLESNWVLLEFAPKELKRISELVEKFKYYDNKLGDMVKSLLDKKSHLYEAYINQQYDSNVHLVISMETALDSARYDKLNSEFSLSRFENDVKNFYISLAKLIEVCGNIAFTKLFKLYSDLNTFETNELLTNDDNIHRDKLKDEINKYICALVSVIKGHRQLNSDDSTLLVNLFNETFLMPFFESTNLLTFLLDDQNSKSFLSFQKESNNFPKFVDSVENNILNPKNSFLMRFLDDLSAVLGDETFKSLCVLDPVAKAVFRFVEESYSSIFTPIYPEYYTQNYKAFDRLLTILETYSDKSNKNLLKWRGSQVPYSFATRFCTGVICDNFVEKVCSVVYEELDKHHELDGNFHKVDDKRFYVSSTSVVYKQIMELFCDENFFYHLFPQYLKGLEDIFKAFINHVDSFITHMESTNNESSENIKNRVLWPSGLSFAYSTYVLHDVLELLDSVKTEDLKTCSLGFQKLGLESVNLGMHNLATQDINVHMDNVEYPVKFPNSVENGVESKLRSGFVDYSRNCPGNEFGNISKVLLKKVQKPLNAYVNGKGLNLRDKEYGELWENCLNVYYNSEQPKGLDKEEHRDLSSLFFFTIKAMKLVCDFLNSVHEHMNFVKDKLEQYVVSSLYNSSKCSLQFIQSLSSKYRSANKHDSYQVSDYVKFLVAPICSFNEFSMDILSKDVLKKLMVKTIQLVSSDYINHISNLLKSVEALNSSLMNPKNISLSEYSESFLFVDIEMLKKQISIDVGEFYDTCINTFKVDKQECSSLNLLLKYR